MSIYIRENITSLKQLLSGKPIALLAIAFLLSVNTVTAQEAWPQPDEWVGLITADWSKSADPGDQQADYLDIVPDDDGYDSYFYSTSTSIFVRLGLEGTILDNKGFLKPFAWQSPIDVDNDDQADWNIVVGGISEHLRVFYDNTGTNDPSIKNWEVFEPVQAGFVREFASPTIAYPDHVFLEVQVPYTALQGSGLSSIDVTLGTPISFYFSTSTSESINIKDATGGSATITEAFANALVVGTGTASFGFIHDKDDPDPYTTGATYADGSTVYLEGYGWPPSTSLNTYIKDSAGSTIWTGTVTTDATGNLINQTSWTVGGSYAGGECTIWVTHPTLPEEGDAAYDTFTVPDPPLLSPDISILKTADVDSVREGNGVTYTASISNVGLSDANVTTLIDSLPAGLSYVLGSSSSLTANDPVITGNLASGFVLTWTGTWTILSGNNITLVYSTTLESGYGDNNTYSNNFRAEGSNFTPSSAGASAPVKFLPPAAAGPDISISKVAASDTLVTSSSLSYTITISNAGDTAGDIIEVRDVLPAGFSYVASSSTGLTTSEPTLSGDTLIWTGTWTVGADGSGSNTVTQSFTASASATAGDYDNQASVEGSNFALIATGPTATVTLIDPPASALFSIAKTVNPTTVASGDTVQYSIVVTNQGGVNENATAIVDTLPNGFSYIPGSTTGLTTADPNINGQIISWTGSWRVSKNNGTQTINFSARAGFENTTYYNQAVVLSETLDPVGTGLTAALVVEAPELVLSKTVDIVNAAPGDTLTYVVTFSNVGQADATVISILENIPVNTSYVDGSAASTPAMDISFTTMSGTVSSIQYLLNSNLAPGNSGSITFKVIID